MKTKQTLKKWLAVLCMVTIVVTSIGIMPKMEASAADAFAGYTEVTLSDFGIAEKTYVFERWDYNFTKALADNTLNKKKITFNVTFYDALSLLTFGELDSSYTTTPYPIRTAVDVTKNTLTFYSPSSNTGTIEFSAADMGIANIAGTKLRVEIGFEVVNSDVKVVASVNGCTPKTGTYKGFASSFGSKVGVYVAGDSSKVDLENVQKDAFAGYDTITLDNFGIAKDSYTHTGSYAAVKPLKGGSTLNKKKTVFYATFHQDNAILTYGEVASAGLNTIRILPSVTNNKITIYSQARMTGQLDFTLSDMKIASLKGTKIKFAIAVEWVGTSLKVTAQINDGTSKSMLLTEYPSSTLGNYLGVLPNKAGVTIDLESYYEKSPTTLQKVSWADYGITEDKTYTTADVPSNLAQYGLISHTVKSDVKSLDNTSFRGAVAFTRASAESGYYINYGDTGLNGWGLKITPQNDGTLALWGGINGDGATAGEVGVALATIRPEKVGKTSFTNGETFELGIDIWKDVNPLDVRTDLKIVIYIDGNQYNLEAYTWKNAAYYKYLSTNINFRKLADGDAIKVDLPEASPETLTRVGWENFDILNDTTYTNANGSYTSTVNTAGTSLINTSFRGKVAFNKVNTDGSCYISFGDTAQWNSHGILIKPQNDGTLIVQGIDTVTSVHPTIATLDPKKAGLTSFSDGTVFELGLDIWTSGNDLKINIFIDGVQYTFDAYVWANAAKNNLIGKYNNFWINRDNDSIKVVVPEKEASPEGLTYIDWEDFGISEDVAFSPTNEDVADGSHFREAASKENLIGTSFRGILNLTRSAAPAAADYYYICYGSTGSKWSGLRMNLATDGKLKIVGVGTETTNVSTQDFGLINPVAAGIGSFTGKSFELGIDMWKDGNDIKFNLFFNGKQYNISAYTWKDAATKNYIGNVTNLIVHGANDSMEVNLATPKGCDIVENEAGYLLAGTTMRVDDVMVTNGTTLTEKGDYHVLHIGQDGVSAENVSCYIPGDAHPDDVRDVRDLVATEKASQGYRLPSGVARWSANADKNSTVDDNDTSLVRDMLLTATTAVSNIASYALGADKSIMPIGGFYGPYESLMTDQAFKLIKDSGVNFMTFSPYIYGAGGTNEEQVKETLRLAEKNNLSVFVTDERIRGSRTELSAKQIADIIKDYNQYKSFVGLSVIDEPSISNYGEADQLATREMNFFSKVSKSVNAYANISAYSNLFPLSELCQIDKTTPYETLYKNYLTSYCENYKPKYLSYDHYPFEWTTSAVTGFYSDGIDTQKYFKNLAIVRKVAEDYKIPFWTFIGAGDYFGNTTVVRDHSNPSEGEFKWQVNVELAFGAKGIQYFPLVQPIGWEVTNNTVDYGKNGLIGANGAKTTWYDYAVDMNNQIKSVDHVLMNSSSEGIMVTSYGYAKDSMAAAGQYDMPILSNYNNVVTGIETTGKEYGAIAGCFDYQGKTAVYLVNYDVESTRTLTLKVNGTRTYTAINRYGENTGKVSNGNLQLDIERGEAVLIVFN